jgi:hypothetical protein
MVHHQSIGVSLTEAMSFAKKRDLFGVLGVSELLEKTQPVRRRLAMLLLDGREVPRALAVRGAHCDDM